MVGDEVRYWPRSTDPSLRSRMTWSGGRRSTLLATEYGSFAALKDDMEWWETKHVVGHGFTGPCGRSPLGRHVHKFLPSSEGHSHGSKRSDAGEAGVGHFVVGVRQGAKVGTRSFCSNIVAIG